MPQIGSNQGIVSQNLSGITDSQGNQIISNENAFGASPAGEALIGQQLFGLPNGTFNLTPPDVYSSLGSDNRLPYWDWAEYSDGTMTATPIYDSTTQTWGITINPGTAANGDYCTLTTRSFLLNDDNLGLRQKAFAIISKGGTAAVSTQWNLTLNAIYYDTTNAAIGTTTIGTALDTGTWTSLSGFTTAGGSAINASARYVELQFKLTATAAVTGSATVTIKSCLLSSKIGANSSFLIVDTFTSSGTWMVPTGVTNVLAVVGVGAGGGGAGGSLSYQGGASTAYVSGAGGGGGASWGIVRDVSLGTATSISIGIGSGGTGGTAAVGTAGATQTKAGGNGGAGGATTFGSIITWSGGAGGTAGTAIVAAGGAGGAIGTVSASYYGLGTAAGTTGSVGGSTFIATPGASSGTQGNSVAVANQVIYPYTTFANLGSNSGSADNTNWGSGANARSTLGAIGTAGTVAFYGAGGGGGGASWSKGYASGSTFAGDGGAGASYGSGGAGGPAFAGGINTSTGMGTTLAGNGGSAGANTGSGGGGGGAVAVYVGGSGTLKAGTAGAGGAGATGFVAVIYIA